MLNKKNAQKDMSYPYKIAVVCEQIDLLNISSYKSKITEFAFTNIWKEVAKNVWREKFNSETKNEGFFKILFERDQNVKVFEMS